ncbi:MAG: hypothetical protein WC100_01350 [Sterolibacterium sp.]
MARLIALAIAAVGLLIWGFLFITGEGSFKRMVTISGVYPVVKPGGYDVVCFLDADSKQGGLSCLPLAAVVKPEGCVK